MPRRQKSPREKPSRLNGNFWRLWWADTVNSVGDGAFVAAMPLLALTVTTDPVQIAAVPAAEYLPWLLVSLPAGVLVDRYDRTRLMWLCQAFQVAIVLWIAIAITTGTVGLYALVVASFLLGCAQVVISNAAQAILPQLVPSDLLPRANSNLYVVQTIGETSLGPPLGSLLFAAAATLPFGLDAGSFAFSAILLATLPRRQAARAKPDSMRKQVAEGLQWLWSQRLLRTLALALGMNTFCNQMGFATLVLLATQTLQLTEGGYGLLLLGIGAGSVLGGLINPTLIRHLGTVPAFTAALAVNAVLYVAMSVAPNVAVLAVLLGLCGLAMTVSTVATVSLRQQMVPDRLLGRVNSVYRMLGWGLMPLGALTGGFVADRFGLRAPFMVAGALRTGLLVALMPVLIAEARILRALVPAAR